MQGKVQKYIFEELEKKKGLLFALIDPLDYQSPEEAVKTAKHADEADADIILIGGSTGVQGEPLDSVAKAIKSVVSKPVVLFPGNIGTLTKYADAVYFMSMLNSRSPYWITGAQMLAAPLLKHYGVEPLPVAYTVVEPGGTVGWVGDAKIIPRNKPKIAAAYGLAAQYTGFKFFITDAGSNPENGHIPLEMIKAVSSTIDIPYIVAGGVRTPEEAKNVMKAGASIIQVGTAFEKKCSTCKVKEMVKAIREGAKSRKAAYI
jgi:phosphoglycerol geranylgeranyltransferase